LFRFMSSEPVHYTRLNRLSFLNNGLMWTVSRNDYRCISIMPPYRLIHEPLFT